MKNKALLKEKSKKTVLTFRGQDDYEIDLIPVKKQKVKDHRRTA